MYMYNVHVYLSFVKNSCNFSWWVAWLNSKSSVFWNRWCIWFGCSDRLSILRHICHPGGTDVADRKAGVGSPGCSSSCAEHRVPPASNRTSVSGGLMLAAAVAAENLPQLLSKCAGCHDVKKEVRRVVRRGNHIDNRSHKVVLGIRVWKLKWEKCDNFL